MSENNWSVRFAVIGALTLLTFVALGTGAFFGALYTPNYGYESKESANRRAQSEQANPAQIDRDRAGLPYIAERVASGPDPESRQEREQRDLAAQESMSVWAFWMLVVSAIGTVTTMIGTGFLLWQIILTRMAVGDTSKATEAMVRQNDLTEAAQRPWVSLEIENVFQLRLQTGGMSSTGMSFSGKMRNYGKSPALQPLILPGLIANADGVHRDEIEKYLFEQSKKSDLWDPPLFPGEERIFRDNKHVVTLVDGRTFERIDWANAQGFMCELAIMLLYRSPDDSTVRRTTRIHFFDIPEDLSVLTEQRIGLWPMMLHNAT